MYFQHTVTRKTPSIPRTLDLMNAQSPGDLWAPQVNNRAKP